jgi:FKBP-type peptidyl-prolyl cis-trans isomerase
MTAKKYARRAAAALVVPALLMTAACGGSEPENKVSGKPGEKPKVTLDKDAKPPKKVSVETLDEGKGKPAAKGDFVRFDVLGKMTGDKKGKGRDLISTWDAKSVAAGKGGKKGAHTQMVSKLGGAQQQALPAKVNNALVGKKPGSRIKVEGTAKSLIGPQATQMGLKPNTGMVWVLDLQSASKVDSKATVEGDQKSVRDGLPKAEAHDKKAATITVPKGEEPPKKLEQQTLVDGKGPKVKAGEGLIAQYTGVKWEDGKKFESSFDQKMPGAQSGPAPFQLGTKSVIPGWDKALEGKHVGDRVLLVAPPKEAYGSTQAKMQAQQQGQKNPLEKNTLVFLIDIVGKV